MARASSAERESRLRVRLLARRTSHGATSGRVTILKPPPTSTIWSPSASTGVSDAKRRASTTSMGWGIGHLRVVPLDHDLPEQLRLPRPRLAQPDQFQQREEGHDQLGAGALAPDHRREEGRPGVAEEGEDLAHALEDGERVRLHLAWRLAPRLLPQAPEGALQEVDAQILERDLLRRRQ